MEKEKISTMNVTWTWADQLSTYRFWGILLFFIFLSASNHIMSISAPLLGLDGMNGTNIAIFYTVGLFAKFGGLWLAWFMVLMRNHYLLYLFSSFTIIGILLLLLFSPSLIVLSISSFLIGLSFGAIALATPTIISGGKGGSEMFVVSFGLITFMELVLRLFSSSFPYLLSNILNTPKSNVITGLVLALVGTISLLPVKADLFNVPPPERKKFLTPIQRNPVIVALLCFVPFYPLYLSYRLHGEINQINPTQNILSPRAAVWITLFFPILFPIIVYSLNSNLIIKLKENNVQGFFYTWIIILMAFIFLPLSFSFIQSNLNQLILIQNYSDAINE